MFKNSGEGCRKYGNSALSGSRCVNLHGLILHDLLSPYPPRPVTPFSEVFGLEKLLRAPRTISRPDNRLRGKSLKQHLLEARPLNQKREIDVPKIELTVR